MKKYKPYLYSSFLLVLGSNLPALQAQSILTPPNEPTCTPDKITQGVNIQQDLIKQNSNCIQDTKIPTVPIIEDSGRFENSPTKNFIPIEKINADTDEYTFRVRRTTQKSQSELSDCYGDEKRFENVGLSTEAQSLLSTMKGIHSYCNNVGNNDIGTYMFEVKLDPNLTNDEPLVIAQWHGRPDRDLYVRSPKTEVSTNFLASLKSIEAHSNEPEYLEYIANLYHNNIKQYERDGQSPLSLTIEGGNLVLSAYSDARIVSDTSKTCSTNNTVIPVGLTNFCYEDDIIPTLNGNNSSQSTTTLWRQPLSSLVSKPEWVKFEVNVKFSRYTGHLTQVHKDSQDTYVKLGFVSLSVNNEVQNLNKSQTSNSSSKKWQGFIGRNDKLGTYFTYGLYAPSGTPKDVEVSFKNVMSLRHGSVVRMKLGKSSQDPRGGWALFDKAVTGLKRSPHFENRTPMETDMYWDNTINRPVFRLKLSSSSFLTKGTRYNAKITNNPEQALSFSYLTHGADSSRHYIRHQRNENHTIKDTHLFNTSANDDYVFVDTYSDFAKLRKSDSTMYEVPIDLIPEDTMSLK